MEERKGRIRTKQKGEGELDGRRGRRKVKEGRKKKGVERQGVEINMRGERGRKEEM